MKKRRFKRPKDTASCRATQLATRKKVERNKQPRITKKLKMGRTREEMYSFVHYRLTGKRLDGQMGGQMYGPKASLRIAFHNQIKDLNVSAQLSPPYPPHPARPTPPLHSTSLLLTSSSMSQNKQICSHSIQEQGHIVANVCASPIKNVQLRQRKTRPDTWQSSCGRLGRSSNAKTARNSKMLLCTHCQFSILLNCEISIFPSLDDIY